ncbi:MAG: HAD-IA family hydrolase [Ruminococcus sp.]|nr:HAD-IA family hydrolase [Ruminococcus sp.]
MIKLAIFDLDGTLADTVEDLADAVNLALEQGGFEKRSVDEIRRFVGNGTKKLIERALPNGALQSEQEKIHKEFSSLYEQNCLNKTKLYDGINEVLKELKSGGIMCAVASNKPDAFSKRIVYSLFEREDFELVLGKADGRKAKPAPDIVFEILSRLDVEKSEAVIIGDSGVDTKTAKAAELLSIGCEWGFRGREELVRSGADFIAEKPKDIVGIIAALNNQEFPL